MRCLLLQQWSTRHFYDATCSARIVRNYSTTFPIPTNNVINIASFNLQVFGPTKASTPEVMAKLAEIISQFDIVAIQEIRDSTGTAIEALELEVENLGIDVEKTGKALQEKTGQGLDTIKGLFGK